MNQCKYSTNKKEWTTLSLEERKLIEKYLRQGFSVNKIAQAIGRHRSTIYRELKKGSVLQTVATKGYNKHAQPYEEKLMYFYDVGQKVAEDGKLRKGNKYKMFQDTKLIEYIEDGILNQGRSPDNIVGRLKETENIYKVIVCTKTIYNYIDKGLLKVKNIDLLLKCRIRQKEKKEKAYKRQLGRSIEERPLEIEERTEFGHFEGDSIIGKDGKSSILTLTERKTRMGFILKVPNKRADTTVRAIKRIIRNRLKPIMKSITFDNGSEFASCSKLEDEIIRIYFAHPYSAYERGTNENYNGIVRRFIPKGKDLSIFKQADLDRIADRINDLPRKILGYKTPKEAFAQEIMK